VRDGGRWVSERALGAGESAFVAAGCVEDAYGNLNGEGSNVAVGASAEVPPAAPRCFGKPPGDTGTTGPVPSVPDGATGTVPSVPDGALPNGGGSAGPASQQPRCTRGGRADERLKGGPASDCIAGGRGDDRIAGKAGADRLIGGPGNDVVVGGPGADEIACGPGRRDRARAGEADTVRGCEKVRGR
jgi:Ca2+-binding RTX toxin-like protein